MTHPTSYEDNGGRSARLAVYAEVGRVHPVATEDGRCLATLHLDAPAVGAVGDWVGERSALDAAEDWLRVQGCRIARAPMELCNFFGHRVCLGPFEDPPYTLEPTEPADRWFAAGYRPAAEYVAVLADSDAQVRRAHDRAAALATAGWSVEALPASAAGLSEAAFHEVIRLFADLYNAAHARHFACQRVPTSVLEVWYGPCRTVLEPSLTFLARAPDRTLAGFLLSLQNLAQPSVFLVHTLAVLPAYQHQGIGTWLVGAAHKAARRRGFSGGVHCMTPREGLRNLDGRVIRRYALLEKEL